ncbi:hypothetical protein SAMN05421823_12116 [Catalinimonas alkaloidigena]|uniref:Uncharacterized protein n=1 Tax=Catalinimonas alkaloidigena TaxID=1075417 RepID=A0A1G9VJQ8_9BACT|nr:hypothetical protein SAMN05421823_12116 [Catalinimonas alkaloidigena]
MDTFLLNHSFQLCKKLLGSAKATSSHFGATSLSFKEILKF